MTMIILLLASLAVRSASGQEEAAIIATQSPDVLRQNPSLQTHPGRQVGHVTWKCILQAMGMMVYSPVPSAHISLDNPLHNPTTLDSSLGISCQAHKWVHNMDPFYKENLEAYIWYQGHIVEDFIPPFINYYPLFFTVPDHKLIGCGIAKSMSQLTINIMCLLYDENRFLADNNSLNDTWITERECLLESKFRQNPSQELLNDPDTVRFAFIRDPIQRFVSLFLDKCIHTDYCECNKSMKCYVERIYNTLRNISDHRQPLKENDLYTFHFVPLSWMCNFETELEKWDLLMMGSDLEERKSAILHLSSILKRQGFNETLVDRIHDDMMGGETNHTTHKSSHREEVERQIREDPYIRDLLHKIYFFDYLIFPFKRDPLDQKYQTNFWELPEKPI